MIRLGEKQKLFVVKKVDFGVYLATQMQSGGQERVLLPIKQVPENCGLGDEIEVFIYKDSQDRMIATTREPKLTLGSVAELAVAQVGKIGAFLDWGLEKDLFLPFKEQTGRVNPGDKILATLYIDKSQRLCATMKVYEYLQKGSPYKTGDWVKGKVYEISDNFGAFVAVDNLYSALIPKRELYGEIVVGMEVNARVTRVLEDGRLNLSVREKAYLQIEKDAEAVLKLLESYAGSLPFTDKAAPEVIRYETGMSKNEFKRAVGKLLKEGKIEITERAIRRK